MTKRLDGDGSERGAVIRRRQRPDRAGDVAVQVGGNDPVETSPSNGGGARTVIVGDGPLPPLTVALLLIFGLFVGSVLSGVWPRKEPLVPILRSDPWYGVWSAVDAVGCALWTLLGYFGLRQLRRQFAIANGLGVREPRQVTHLARLAALGLVLGIAVTLLSDVIMRTALPDTMPFPIDRLMLRADAFTAIGVAGALPSAVGLWWIQGEGRTIGRNIEQTQPIELVTLESFTRLQDSAQGFLALLATSVAAGVIQIGAWRHALIGLSAERAQDYPPEFVLIFGAVFALVVALIYLPCMQTLRQVGWSLRDVAAQELTDQEAPPPAGTIALWLAFRSHRDRLEKALGLDVTVTARIQLSLGLLAPFLAALVGVAVPQ